jgi:hypothetical protein
MRRDAGLAGLCCNRARTTSARRLELLFATFSLAQALGGRVAAAAAITGTRPRRLDRRPTTAACSSAVSVATSPVVPARHQPARSLRDLPFDEVAQGGQIDLPAVNGVTSAGIDPENMGIPLFSCPLS